MVDDEAWFPTPSWRKTRGSFRFGRGRGAIWKIWSSGFPFTASEIIDSRPGDYAFRLIVGSDVVQVILAFLGKTVDYDNFKNEIHRTPDQAHKPYLAVWEVMADALGSYGQPGKKSPRKSG